MRRQRRSGAGGVVGAVRQQGGGGGSGRIGVGFARLSRRWLGGRRRLGVGKRARCRFLVCGALWRGRGRLLCLPAARLRV